MKLSAFLYFIIFIGVFSFNTKCQIVDTTSEDEITILDNLSEENTGHPVNFDEIMRFRDYPDIGHRWNELYLGEPQLVLDSARDWITSFPPIAPHLTVKAIIDVCGKHFYRLDANTIKDRLQQTINIPTNKINTDLEYWKNQLQFMNQDFSSMEIPAITNQIWNEQIGFDLSSFYNNKISDFEGTSPYTEQIADLSWKLDPNGHVVIDEFNKLYGDIQQIKDQWARWLLWMQLAEKLYSLQAVNYLTTVTNEIFIIISEEKSRPLWYAEYMIFCAKILSSFDTYTFGQYIYSYLRYAQIELDFHSKESPFYQKSEVIRALFWKSLPGKDAKISAAKILINYYQNNYYNDDTLDFKFLTLLLDIQLDYLSDISYSEQQMSDIERLYLFTYIYVSTNIYTKLAGKNFESSEKYYLLLYKNLARYYFSEGDYLKSREFALLLLEKLIISTNPLVKPTIPEAIKFISNTYKGTNQHSIAMNWLSLLDSNANETVELSPLFILPIEDSLWTNEHYKLINQTIKKTKTVDFIQPTYNTTYHSQSGGRFLFLKASAFEASQENWKDAYLFSKMADSLKYVPDVGFYIDMISAGLENYFKPIQKKLKDSINVLEHNVWQLDIKISELESEKLMLIRDIGNLRYTVNNLTYLNGKLNDTNRILNDLNYILNDSNKKLAVKLIDLNCQIEDKEATVKELNSQITYLEKLLANRTNVLIIISVVSALIFGLFIWALRERKRARKATRKARQLTEEAMEQKSIAENEKAKAEKSEAKERITAQTMSQIGHLLPEIIRSQSLRIIIPDISLKDIKKQFDYLADTIRTMYLLVIENPSEIIAESELNFSLKLMEMRYSNSKENIMQSEIIKGLNQLNKIKMPTFILFNLIANAFKYGKLIKRKSNQLGTFRVVTIDNCTYFQIEFINSFGTKDEDSTGTGLNFIRNMVEAWNKDQIATNFNTWSETVQNINYYHVGFNLLKR